MPCRAGGLRSLNMSGASCVCLGRALQAPGHNARSIFWLNSTNTSLYLLDSLLQAVHVHAPLMRLIQLVWQQRAAVQGNGR